MVQRVECANPSLTGKIVEVSRAKGQVTYDLTVGLSKDAKAGYFRDELYLITNDPNTRAARVPIPVEGVVLLPVTVHPSPLSMGTTETGTPATAVVRPLLVRSLTPFQITKVESSNPKFRCDPPTTSATLHRLPVTFLGADAAGKITTKIKILTTASPEPLETEAFIYVEPPATAKKADASKPSEKADNSTTDPGLVPTKSATATRQEL